MIELFRPPDKPTPSLRPRKVLKLSILYKYGFQTLRGRSEDVGLFEGLKAAQINHLNENTN